MFSNSMCASIHCLKFLYKDGFKLNYNTLSNEEILDIDIDILSDSGFCFLWVLNSNLQFGLQCLNKWGYKYIDRIVWIKKNRNNSNTIMVSHGYYFLHSTEICLVGAKYSNKAADAKLEYISKVIMQCWFLQPSYRLQMI